MSKTILQLRAEAWLKIILRCLKEYGFNPDQLLVERLGDWDGVSLLMLDLMDKPESEIKDKTLKRDFFLLLQNMPVSPTSQDEFKHSIKQVEHMLPLCIESFAYKEELVRDMVEH